MKHEIRQGDCLELLRAMPDNSVDAVVTDPPYGLSFMGKKWDYDVPSVDVWAECLRVLKPGGHLLAFAGTRTQHRMAVRIEDAGFEIRDMIAWVYGSGFPKSHNVAIGIDKMNGAPSRGKALVVAGRGERKDLQGKDANPRPQELEAYAPATPEAAQWQGWGTALKPALEPITVARKPLDGTVAANVQQWGTGAINVDGCRVGMSASDALTIANMGGFGRAGFVRTPGEALNLNKHPMPCKDSRPHELGRWPANLIHDGSVEVLGCFPETTTNKGTARTPHGGGNFWQVHHRRGDVLSEGDTGSAARFFYCAKASRSERNKGLEGFNEGEPPASARSKPAEGRENALGRPRANVHPTVKPVALMRYLCRLVTPPGGTVLDPFTGSGTTGIAAKLEGFSFIGCEREAEYVAISRARIDAWEQEKEEQDNQLDLFA